MAFGDSKFVARVKVFPFFPDAPTCESEAVSAFCRANAAEPAANPSRSASAFSSETRFTGASVRFVGGALCSRLVGASTHPPSLLGTDLHVDAFSVVRCLWPRPLRRA